ncbi:MAG: 2-oxoacid:acceptor oxidoreductase family protein [Polyangiaceae bacterium]|nr:2-oxoacid:acceptor oxidoreductase family protein [Polyangiaceae bacterium]
MSLKRHQVLLVGVGGQGVLAAAQILGMAAHAEGKPVMVGQLHGMSQRGGSVRCTAVFGGAESSHTSGPEMDVVVAFEPLEALRAVPDMGPATRVVTNRHIMLPFQAVFESTAIPEPDAIVAALRDVAGQVHELDAPALVGAVGETRTLNVLMLGAASGLGLLPVGEVALLDAITERCGRKFAEANRKAFILGRDAFASESGQIREATVQ